MTPRIRILLLLIGAFLLSADIARACDCKNLPVAEQFELSTNVVVAKLRSVDRTRAETGIERPERPIPASAVFTVERAYKGKFKPGDQMKFMQEPEGDCDMEFYEADLDKEFLFYLGTAPGKNKLWTASMCSRSALLAPDEINLAPADLLYLDNLGKVRGKTRVSGRVWRSEGLFGGGDRLPWLARRTVRITGNGREIRLKTDQNGVFEIYDLPPGKYTISPGALAGYRLGADGPPDNAAVDLKPGKQAEFEFRFEIASVIKGRLFDAGGEPVAGAELRLQPVQQNPPDPQECRSTMTVQLWGPVKICLDRAFLTDFVFTSTTSADGSFEFSNIPARTYLLSLYVKTSDTEPDDLIFYPGTGDRAAAGTLSIEPGTTLDNLVIRLPEK
jgi:hypothetical protein